MYFHSLINRPKNHLVYIFAMSQFSKMNKKDWMAQTLADFDGLKINRSFEYIQSVSKFAFRKIAKAKIREYAFQELMKKKNQYSKLKKVNYSKFKMQSYLTE